MEKKPDEIEIKDISDEERERMYQVVDLILDAMFEAHEEAYEGDWDEKEISSWKAKRWGQALRYGIEIKKKLLKDN